MRQENTLHEAYNFILRGSISDPRLCVQCNVTIAHLLTPTYLALFAHGYYRFAGLMLIDNVRGAGISVEVSEIGARMKELGRDTIPMRNVLLGLPAFTHLDQIRRDRAVTATTSP